MESDFWHYARPLLEADVRTRVLATLTLIGTGCTVPSPQPNPLVVITTAPSTGGTLPRDAVTMSATVTRMSVLNGAVALATSDGLLVAQSVGATTFAPAPLASAGQSSTGAVSALTLQQDGNLLVAAANGLFVSSGGSLRLSPFSSVVPQGAVISSMSTFGTGDAEQLWFISGTALALASNGAVQVVSLPNTASPQQVVAMAENQAAIVADGEMVAVNLNINETLVLVPGVGNAYGSARDASGTAWFATDSGLISFSPAGALVALTMSGSSTPSRVCGVFADSSGVFAATGSNLVQVSGTSASILYGSLASTTGTCPLAVDSKGGIYVDDGTVGYFPNTPLISFARQVEPILNMYCATCHATGTNNAPIDSFSTDYMTAVNESQTISAYITGSPPLMPLAGFPQLTASDLSTVLGWINESPQLP
jgi:hypothetical protein